MSVCLLDICFVKTMLQCQWSSKRGPILIELDRKWVLILI